MYVYQNMPSIDQTPNWVVGFYDPTGVWRQESRHDAPPGAAERVHYLNGGSSDKDTVLHRRAMEQPTHAIRNMPRTVRMHP